MSWTEQRWSIWPPSLQKEPPRGRSERVDRTLTASKVEALRVENQEWGGMCIEADYQGGRWRDGMDLIQRVDGT